GGVGGSLLLGGGVTGLTGGWLPLGGGVRGSVALGGGLLGLTGGWLSLAGGAADSVAVGGGATGLTGGGWVACCTGSDAPLSVAAAVAVARLQNSAEDARRAFRTAGDRPDCI